MKRIKLVVAYDGTNYKGWQIQKNGETIESVLNRILSEMTGETVHVMGASRTDSGVHAMGNIAVFDTNVRMPGDKFSYALNQRLPEDIRIQHSCEVEPAYHPRYLHTVKTYEYRILNREFPLPAYRLHTYFTYHPLDVERMRQAAAYLVGEHDFKSFCAAGAQVNTTVRTIYSLQILKEDELLTIRVSGNGFLYNMVRIIAGTLMKIGRGEWEPEQIQKILEAKDRREAGPTAPARGLTLMSIEPLTETESSDE